MKHRLHISEQIRKHWFLIGILVCIILSAVHPNFGTKDGPLNPDITVKYGAVSLIFFISGISLKTDSLLHTIKEYRLHLFIQIFTFLIIPVFIQVIVKFLSFFGINGWILKGVISVGLCKAYSTERIVMKLYILASGVNIMSWSTFGRDPFTGSGSLLMLLFCISVVFRNRGICEKKIIKKLLNNLITVACMPPPVSSAVILTRAAQGNEAAAIFNSVVGSFLGIIVTPMSLLLNLGITTLVPLMGTLVQLSITVITPLVIGQLLRHYTTFRGHNLPLNTVGQCALLFVIYTTFCDSFTTHEVGLSAPDILITVFLVVVLQVFLLAMSFSLALNFQHWFSTSDIVAIVFCSTHKSLTLGVPILKIMFHGFSHLSQISLPLLVYHPTQIIMGGLIVSHLKGWVREQRYRKLPM